MRNIAKYSKVFLLLIAAYFVFGVLSSWLPDKAIKRHIAESAPMIAAEGLYPKLFNNMEQYRMDNFTDALMMNQIYNIDRKHPVKAAMRMVRSSEEDGDWNQTGLLVRCVNGETLEEQHYSRYWHGGSFLYRPLFMLMDYATLRFVLFIASAILLLLLACCYFQKAGWVKTLALFMGFLLTYGVVTQFSMQFFPVLALTVIGSLLVVKSDASKGFGLLFFIIGSLTCYFDLLTTPLLTLGIPLAVMLSLKPDEGFLLKKGFVECIQLILLWGLGFALTFVTKWALASLVLGQNIFADAYEVSLYRMEADEFTRWDAVTMNLEMLNWWIVGIVAVGMLVFKLVKYWSFNYKKAILFLIIALMPYVWYFILSNHSYLHWWFTFRLQAVTVISLLFVVVDSRFFEDRILSKTKKI
jgi:hypothetical protein